MTTRVRQNVHTGLVALTFFTLFASDAWRNLIGWWGYLALAGALVLTWVILIIVARRRLYWRVAPWSLVLWLAWAGCSIAWSHYPGASALGWVASVATAFLGFAIVLTTNRPELVRGLGFALRWILALSLLFEAIVALFVRHPVLPFWVDWGDGKIPKAFYWSQNQLFHLGPLQGIVGNRNLLGFIALLALIVFCVQLADRVVWRGSGILWIVIAAATLVLTRSSTVWLALVVVVFAAAMALWTRRLRPSRRWPVYAVGTALGAGALVTLPLWWATAVAALGRSADATGRTQIWATVWEMITQRPVVGWGWVSYWAPWVDPFDHLVVIKGVRYLQAHNAWLDVWMQIGIIGLILFAAVCVAALWRAWFLAVDRPRWDLDSHRPFTAHALMPLLLLVALLVQSIAESRILVEGGFLLLVAIVVAVKMPARGLGERR